MATLKIVTASPPPPPKEYVLTLTEAEARAVRLVVGAVSGSGAFRAACTSVWNVLHLQFGDNSPLLPEIAATAAADSFVRGE